MAKKDITKKIGLWIFLSIIVLVIIAGFIGFFLAGINFFSIIAGGTGLVCVLGGADYWDCSTAGVSSASMTLDNINIINPTNAEEYKSLLINRADGDLLDFFSSHSEFERGDYCTRRYTPLDIEILENDVEVTTKWKNLDVIAMKSTTGSSYIELNWCQEWADTMKQSLLTIKGTLKDEQGNPLEGSFSTYGFCNAIDRSCTAVEPLDSMAVTTRLIPTEIKIYHWEGGAYPSDVCTLFNIGCPDEEITVYRLENNICKNYTILESEIIDSDYLTLESCEKDIKPNYLKYILIGISGIVIFIFVGFLVYLGFRKR